MKLADVLHKECVAVNAKLNDKAEALRQVAGLAKKSSILDSLSEQEILAGLIGGARLGAVFGHVEDKVKKYVGLGILSQAGVAIGLSLIVKHEFTLIDARYDAPHALAIGSSVLATITATCIFFEIIGPIMTKVALKRAGEIPDVEAK